jgi:hypothetical protein
MLKRLFSLLLVCVIFFVFVAAPSALAADDDYSIRIVGRLDSNTQYQSRYTYTVAFQVKTSNGAGILGNWDCQFAYDASVFELVSMDGSRSLSDADIALRPGAPYVSISASRGFSSIFSEYWQAMLFAALSADGNTGYISMQALTFESEPYELDTYTALHTIRFAFKDGISLNDVSDNAIRFVSSQEMKALPGVTSQILLNNGTHFFEYGTISGELDTLSVPVFDLEIGLLTSESTSPPLPPSPNNSGFEYIITDGEVTITGYTGNATEIEIPAVIDGYPVIAVEKDAFADLSDDVTIYVPNEIIRSSVEESGFAPSRVIIDTPNRFPAGALIAMSIIVIALGGGILLYFKVIRPKKCRQK